MNQAGPKRWECCCVPGRASKCGLHMCDAFSECACPPAHTHLYSKYVEDGSSPIRIENGYAVGMSWGHYECECGATKPPPLPPIQGCITRGEWLWGEIQEFIEFEEGSHTDDNAIVQLLDNILSLSRVAREHV